jgi:hypothetical protein
VKVGPVRRIALLRAVLAGLLISCSPVSGQDAGPPDASTADAAGFDGGTPDSGPDAGTRDAGTLDAGSSDAGIQDAGVADGGAPDAGLDAGGPNGQLSYTYPGCEDGGSYYCPNAGIFTCALKTIQAKYASCTSPQDCVAVSATNCIDMLTFCPPAAVSNASAFLAEANAEGASYCAGDACHISGSCAISYQSGLTDCINGTCVAVPDDAGL